MTDPLSPSPGPSLLSRLVMPVGVATMLVEEYVWKGLKRVMARLARLASVARVEAWVASLPPPGAVVAFAAPAVLALPVKLAAVWSIANGHALVGLAVLIGAKLVATALYVRLYSLCRPALAHYRWFVRLQDAVVAAKNWAHARLDAWPAWRQARQMVVAVRAAIVASPVWRQAGEAVARGRAGIAAWRRRLLGAGAGA